MIIMGKLLDNRGNALRTCCFAGASATSARPWNSLKDNTLDNLRLEEQFSYNSGACGRLIANTWPEPEDIRLLTQRNGNIAECRITQQLAPGLVLSLAGFRAEPLL